MIPKVSFFPIFCLLIALKLPAQNHTVDTLSYEQSRGIKIRPIILPAILIGIGAIGCKNGALQSLNYKIHDEVVERISKKIPFDEYCMFVPILSAYSFDLLGIKGVHSFEQKTAIVGISSIINLSVITAIKYITKIERPDKSTRNSFPSGHTAAAFMSAEFLYQEYKAISVWYGIGGYILASGVGFFRMYNNRHWLTDVCAGAGIGILSTKIAYRIFPQISRRVVQKDMHYRPEVHVLYDGNDVGLNLRLVF